jgi:hypothetical protein
MGSPWLTRSDHRFAFTRILPRRRNLEKDISFKAVILGEQFHVTTQFPDSNGRLRSLSASDWFL